MGIGKQQRVVGRQGNRQGEELRRAVSATQRRRQTIPTFTTSADSGSALAAGKDEDLFTGGRLIEGLSIPATSDLTIHHGMDAPPTRWVFVSIYCLTSAIAPALYCRGVSSSIFTIHNPTAQTVTCGVYLR